MTFAYADPDRQVVDPLNVATERLRTLLRTSLKLADLPDLTVLSLPLLPQTARGRLDILDEWRQGRSKGALIAGRPFTDVEWKVVTSDTALDEAIRAAKAAIDAHPFASLSRNDGREAHVSSTYVPVLRSLRGLSDAAGGKPDDLFAQIIRADHFGEQGPSGRKLRVFTGLGLYETLKSHLLGDLEERQRVADFQRFLGDSFFQGQAVALIPKHNGHQLHVKIGRQAEQPISKIGDGVGQIVILTFCSFMEELPHLFFIEEPELALHPGLQRQLLSWMAGHPLHSFFLTTHSNHFLELTADLDNISVFQVTEVPQPDAAAVAISPRFHVRACTPGDRNLLADLGVRNASVFLANKTIWVEGITERLYLRRWLEILMDREARDAQARGEAAPRRLREDVDFAFVEYAGSNVGHWIFAETSLDPGDAERPIAALKLCGKPFLIADNDDGAHRARKEKLRDQLEGRFLELPVREAENLVPPDVLWRFARSREPSFPIEPPSGWPDYQNPATRLSEHIRGRLEPLGPRLKWAGDPWDARKRELREWIAKDENFRSEDLVGPANELTETVLKFLREPD